MKKVFIVGCSRSGTTLIQKRLIENSRLWTMPETGWYLANLNSFYGRATAIGRLHTAMQGREVPIKPLRFLLGCIYIIRKAGLVSLLKLCFSRNFAHKFFSKFISSIARSKGLDGWVEKTPLHFRVMDLILNTERDSKVIFVIRKGEDVVASIYDRHINNPRYFPDQNSYEYGVNLWNESLTKAIKYLRSDRVKIISYDAYVRNEEEGIKGCLVFLGVDKDTSANKNINFVRSEESWKSNVREKVSIQKSKFNDIFSSEDMDNIQKSINTECYDYIKKEIAADK